MSMRKLLVAIDASASAQRALDHAVMLAGLSKACELVIVNVHEPAHDLGRGAAFQSAAEINRRLDEQSASVVQPAVAKAMAAGVKASGTVLTGEVAKAIVQHASEHGCDGIVMATHGRGVLGNALMGSVATAVVHQTRLPVTLVK